MRGVQEGTAPLAPPNFPSDLETELSMQRAEPRDGGTGRGAVRPIKDKKQQQFKQHLPKQPIRLKYFPKMDRNVEVVVFPLKKTQLISLLVCMACVESRQLCEWLRGCEAAVLNMLSN